MEHDVWKQCLDQLKLEISEKDFMIWINPLSASQFNDELRLFAPNKYVFLFISEHHLCHIKQLIALISNNTMSVTLHQAAESQSGISITNDNQYLKSNLWPQMCFNNFINGSCNQSAIDFSLQLCRMIISGKDEQLSPAFIYGSCGLGKTHLLHAIGNKIADKLPDGKILYLNSDQFVQEMILATDNNTITEWLEFYENLDLLLLDGVQFFSGKSKSSGFLCEVINAFILRKKYVVLVTDVHPQQFDFTINYLNISENNRVELKYPELNTRIKLINQYAEQEGYSFALDVLIFLANLFHSCSILNMNGELRRIIASSRAYKKEITIDYIKSFCV